MIMTTMRSMTEAQSLCSRSAEYRITEVFRYLIDLEAPGYVRDPGHQHFCASCMHPADSMICSCTGIHARPVSTQRTHVSRHDVTTHLATHGSHPQNTKTLPWPKLDTAPFCLGPFTRLVPHHSGSAPQRTARPAPAWASSYSSASHWPQWPACRICLHIVAAWSANLFNIMQLGCRPTA
jgi:hypothetical protein